MSVINKGSEGPYLVICFEVPNMFQKTLACVRKPYLAILEYLNPYPPPNKPYETKTIQQKYFVDIIEPGEKHCLK